MRYKDEFISLGDSKQTAAELNALFDKDTTKKAKQAVEEWVELVRLRREALIKHADKFNSFFIHLDGEIVVGKFSNRDNTPTFWLMRAHNFLVNGTKIRKLTIRKPPGVTLDNIPFIANVEMVYANRYLLKKSVSSFFPKNWNVNRIQEEVALVYDDLIKQGKDFLRPPFKYVKSNSDGSFEILIEFDKLGNLTNAYTNLKL